MTTFEYDTWKPQNPTADDRLYFTSRKEYFDTWKAAIIENGTLPKRGREYNLFLFPPYSFEEVEEFERLNKIHLPIQLKYYLTNISCWIGKHFGRIFKIYDETYCLGAIVIESNYVSIRDPNLIKRYNEMCQTHPIWKDDRMEEGFPFIPDYKFEEFVILAKIQLPYLVVPFLQEDGDTPWMKNATWAEASCWMNCDGCQKVITDKAFLCDICPMLDFCCECVAKHAHKTTEIVRFPPVDVEHPCFCRDSNNVRCEKRLSLFSTVGFCWECNKRSCGECLAGNHHNTNCTGQVVKYTISEKKPLEKVDSLDVETLEKYHFRFDRGSIAIGDFGCGEREWICVSGKTKGQVEMLTCITGELSNVKSLSFFNYLVISTSQYEP